MAAKKSNTINYKTLIPSSPKATAKSNSSDLRKKAEAENKARAKELNAFLKQIQKQKEKVQEEQRSAYLAEQFYKGEQERAAKEAEKEKIANDNSSYGQKYNNNPSNDDSINNKELFSPGSSAYYKRNISDPENMTSDDLRTLKENLRIQLNREQRKDSSKQDAGKIAQIKQQIADIDNTKFNIPLTDEKTITVKYNAVQAIDDYINNNKKQDKYKTANGIDEIVNNLGLNDEELQNTKSYAGLKKLSLMSSSKGKDNLSRGERLERELTQMPVKFLEGAYNAAQSATNFFKNGFRINGDYSEQLKQVDDYYTANPDKLGNDYFGDQTYFSDFQKDYLANLNLNNFLERYNDTSKLTHFIAEAGMKSAGNMLGAAATANMTGIPQAANAFKGSQAALAAKGLAATKAGQKATAVLNAAPKIGNITQKGLIPAAANKVIGAVNNVSAGKALKFLNPFDNPTTAVMGIASAQEKYNELRKMGYGEKVSKNNALFTGYVNAITEKMGYDGTDEKMFLTGGKMLAGSLTASKTRNVGNMLKKYLSSNISEGMEEIYATVFERAGDFFSKVGYEDGNGKIQQRTIAGKGGILDSAALGESFLGGFVGGAVMGSVGLLGNIANNDVQAVRDNAEIIEKQTDSMKKSMMNVLVSAGIEDITIPDAPKWDEASIDEINNYYTNMVSTYSRILSDERVISNDSNVIKNASNKISEEYAVSLYNNVRKFGKTEPEQALTGLLNVTKNISNKFQTLLHSTDNTEIFYANVSFLSEPDNVISEGHISDYAEIFVNSIANTHSRAYTELSQKSDNLPELLTNYVVKGITAPEMNNDNMFVNTANTFKNMVESALNVEYKFHNMLYDNNPVLDTQMVAIKNGDFSVVESVSDENIPTRVNNQTAPAPQEAENDVKPVASTQNNTSAMDKNLNIENIVEKNIYPEFRENSAEMFAKQYGGKRFSGFTQQLIKNFRETGSIGETEKNFFADNGAAVTEAIRNAINSENSNVENISDRTFDSVGNRRVKAFQYSYPQMKKYYSEMANVLLGDIKATIKGERTPIFDESGVVTGYTGTERHTSEAVARIKDTTGASYDEIADALNRIIADSGQENIALAKRIELVMDDMLTEGYTAVDGTKVPANEDYIAEKALIENKSGKSEVKQQIINDYAQAVDDIMTVDDETAKALNQNGTFVSVLEKTPDIILNNVENSNDLPIIMMYNKLYMAVRRNGVFKGHYHNLGADVVKQLPNYLASPDVIIQLPNGRINILTSVETERGNNGIISVELNTYKKTNGKYNQYNMVITMFSSDDKYVKNLLSGEGVTIKYIKKDLLQGSSQLYKWLSAVNNKSFIDNSIPQDNNIVNNKDMQETENNSDNDDLSKSTERAQSRKMSPELYDRFRQLQEEADKLSASASNTKSVYSAAELESRIKEQLANGVNTVDEITRKIGAKVNDIHVALFNMAVNGDVKQKPGNRYELISDTTASDKTTKIGADSDAAANKNTTDVNKSASNVEDDNGDNNIQKTESNAVTEEKSPENVLKSLSMGESVSVEEVKAAANAICDNEAEIKAGLSKLKNAELKSKMNIFDRGSYSKKDDMVEAIYSDMLSNTYYTISGKNSMTTFMNGTSMNEQIKGLIKTELNSLNAERLKTLSEKYSEEHKKHIAEREKIKNSLKNPQTLEDYSRKKRTIGLSEQENADFEKLYALTRKENRNTSKSSVKSSKTEAADNFLKNNDNFTIEETKHSKTGENIWVVKPKERLATEEWKNINNSMKSLGGFYWKGNGGWNFKKNPIAEKVSEETSVQGSNVDKLRDIADNMQKSIDERFRERLTNTAKRASQAASAEAEGEKLQRTQNTIRNIAEGIENGNIKLLTDIDSKAQVETLFRLLNLAQNERINSIENITYSERLKERDKPYGNEDIKYAKLPLDTVYSGIIEEYAKAAEGKDGYKMIYSRLNKALKGAKNNYISVTPQLFADISKVVKNLDVIRADYWEDGTAQLNRLKRMGIENNAELRAYLREFVENIPGIDKEAERKRAIKKKEVELTNSKIDGFFPTPKSIVEKMLGEADIKPGEKVLEPSAGKGNIADAIRESYPNNTLDVVEWNASLNELLTEKGHNVVGVDFLQHSGVYDKIIMNPPFENGQDIDHIRHAYSLLNDGGRVVCIMSEGPFYRSDKKATDFRKWFDEVGGVSEKLPENSFKGSERSTGVNTRLVVVDKLSAPLPGKSNSNVKYSLNNNSNKDMQETENNSDESPRVLTSDELKELREKQQRGEELTLFERRSIQKTLYGNKTTPREITSLAYKRAQRNMEKDFDNFFGIRSSKSNSNVKYSLNNNSGNDAEWWSGNKITVSTKEVTTELTDLNKARKEFVNFARENFPKSVTNINTKKKIGISRTGIDKFLSGNINKEKYATGFKIPQLIESAVKVGEAGNKKGKQGINGYEYYYNTLIIDGKDYAAHIRVRNTDMGDKYYGHTISQNIVDIEIEPLAWNSDENKPVHSINAYGSSKGNATANSAKSNSDLYVQNDNSQLPVDNIVSQDNNIVNNNDMRNTENNSQNIENTDDLSPIQNNIPKAAGLIQDEYSSKLDSEEANAMDLLGRVCGVRIKILPELQEGKANGAYQDNTIYLALNADEKIMSVFSHEITHHFEKASPKAYEEYKKAIFEIYENNYDKSVSETAKEIIQLYSEKGIKLSYNEAVNEVIADETFRYLENPEKITEMLYNASRLNDNGRKTILQKFISAVKTIISKIKKALNINMPENVKTKIDASEKAVNSLEAMVREAKGNFAFITGTDNKSSYSIKKDIGGNKYVHIDNDVLDGVPQKEWAKAISKWLNQNVQGRTFTAESDGDLIKVNRKLSSEYPYGINTKTISGTPEYSAKMNLAGNIDEAIKVSQKTAFANDKVNPDGNLKHGSFAKNGWDYRSFDFEYKGKRYTGDLNVAKGNSGNIAYDVTNIKEVTSNGQNAKSKEPRIDDVTSINSISKNNDTVNRHYMQRNEKNSGNDTQFQLKGVGNISKLVQQYGHIPSGEKPARDVEVPKKISDTQYVSKFARTAMEAGVTPDESISEFEQLILDGKVSYERITDKSAEKYAKDFIKENGFDGAMDFWDKLIKDNRRLKKNDIALGLTLYNQCITSKDTANAMKLISDLAIETTNAGQVIQSVRMLKKMSPDGSLYYMEKSVQKLNKEFSELLGKKFKDIKLNEKLMQKVLEAKTEKAKNAALDEVMDDVAEQIPSTMRDKWDSWRYLAMLGNPRTHIRNIVGNAVFVPVVEIKNMLGTAIEKTVPKEQRTKSVMRSNGTVEFAKEDALTMQKALQGNSGKYEMISDINSRRRIFKFTPLEKLRIGNGNLLEFEDWLFLKRAYVSSLSGIMTARGFTPEYFNSGTAKAVEDLSKCREYAIAEAQKATYRDANKLASLLNELQNRARKSDSVLAQASGVVMEGVIPFKKTPLNILKRGVEYSPIGLINGTVKMIKGVRKGDFTATEAIDDISKGLVGVGILLFGMFLKSLNLIDSDDSDKSAKEDKYDDTLGKQAYALKIGDKSYTIDWVVPAALPLFIGVEIGKALEKENFQPADILNAAAKISEPMMELSVLQGLSSTLQSAAYSGTDKLTATITNAVVSYFTQAVPTLGGQIARTIDKTQRTTYNDKNSQLPDAVNRVLQQTEKKIPFLSMKLQPKIDLWGREVTYGNSAAARAASNFLSPGYYSKENVTSVDKKIIALHEATGDSDCIPSAAAKKITVNGKEINLTASEYTEFAKLKGSKSYNKAKELMDNKTTVKLKGKDNKYKTMKWSDMTNDEKVKALKNVYQDANTEARYEIAKRYYPKEYKAAQKKK